MKRKQKTPRRLRPVGDSDEEISKDASMQACFDTNTKQQKTEVETQTNSAATTSKNTQTIALDGFFKNESDNEGLPLILNVYSLSDRSSKLQECHVTSKNNFPVTPPCSPPLRDKGDPIIISQHSYRYASTNRYPLPNNVPICNTRTQYIPQEVLYDNPITTQSNIANGVLPVERTSNQPQHFYFQQPVNQNTINYYTPENVSNTCGNPLAQLREMFTVPNQYLVPKESSFTRNSNIYTRFKLQQNSTNTFQSIVPKTVSPATSSSNQPQNIVNNNYATNSGPFIRNHYEVNRAPSTMAAQVHGNKVSVDNCLSTNDIGLLTSREMKVIKLKKLIQEQEEFLKRLKTHH